MSDDLLPDASRLYRGSRRRFERPKPAASAAIVHWPEAKLRAQRNARILRERALVEACPCNTIVAGEVFDRFMRPFLMGKIPRDGGGWRQGIRWMAGVRSVRIYGRDQLHGADPMGFPFWRIQVGVANRR